MLREAVAAAAASIAIACAGGVALADPDTSVFRIINITTDSASGWRPSEELEHSALDTLKTFDTLKTNGSFAPAYAMLTPGNQRMIAAGQWAIETAKFNSDAGKPLSWRMLKLTWTKDPANAPALGIYAAIDFTGKFERVSRYCGSTVLYAPDEQSPFRVMRTEQNFITDESAAAIERGQGAAVLADAWAATASHCPSFRIGN